ncbi:TadE-like protein [Devosia crocina]|uniref:TadE-like protein n=1 Tax=Devosia crocina TaxID=429728 RepID=A0A1I7NSD9_9HYPH|nr:TadE/TadG family type IV pilus assembly protein [Devosia crocina]SFV37530.1 TadE-like protein [Devosia crocina]
MNHISGKRTGRFVRDERGVSALEFALVAPIIFALLAVVVDFGMLVQTRANMETALSSAMSFGLARGQDVDAAEAAGYAASLADIASTQLGEDTALNVTLNRSFITTRGRGSAGQTGSANAVSLCYCPERKPSGIDWGTSRICTAPCPNGGHAGLFLAIKAARPYRPLFLDYGLVSDGQIVIETLAGLR